MVVIKKKCLQSHIVNEKKIQEMQSEKTLEKKENNNNNNKEKALHTCGRVD